MHDLGVELQSVGAALVVAHGRNRAGCRAGHGPEPFRHDVHLVAVAHPHLELAGDPVEEGGWVRDVDHGAAVLASMPGLDRAAQHFGGHLESVADAQHGDAELKDRGVTERRAVLEDTGRTA